MSFRRVGLLIAGSLGCAALIVVTTVTALTLRSVHRIPAADRPSADVALSAARRCGPVLRVYVLPEHRGWRFSCPFSRQIVALFGVKSIPLDGPGRPSLFWLDARHVR